MTRNLDGLCSLHLSPEGVPLKTLALVLLLGLAIIASPTAHAAVTKCDAIDPPSFSVQWLAFDAGKGTAQMQFSGAKFTGRVTYTRRLDKNGNKYTFVFPSPFGFPDALDTMEVVLFPVSSSAWRLGGVITKSVDGRRHVDLLVPGQDLLCQTIEL